MISLRPYQDELITGVRQHFREGRKRVLIQLPTGGGKSATCARMLHNAAERNKRVWFLCHRRELVGQIARAFELEGIDYGLVTADAKMNLSAQAQICSIPTLANRIDRLPAPDLLAFDEAHHVASRSWSGLAKAFPDAYHVGLSATPVRLDGAGLGDYYDAMVSGPSVRWLIENNFLSQYRLFAPTELDTSGLHKRMGDYVQSESLALVNKPRITGNAIDHYRKHCDGARAIAFCVSVEHSKAVAQAFNDAGIPALHIDGKTDSYLRDQMMTDFSAGKVRVITNVDLFGEGYDCPSLEAVILLRPTMSLGMYMQQVGRALRPAPGKEHAIILDHVGNSQLHGLPDDDREWKLTTGKPEKSKSSVPPPRICGLCFAANRSGATTCRVCGQSFPVESRQVEQVDGELSEIDAAREKREQRIVQGLTKDLESLIALGRMRGYKSPERWAHAVINGREKNRVASVR